MTDDSELTRHISQVAEAATRRTGRCPPPAQLAVYVDSGLGGRARSGVEDHLADCAYCRGQVGFLVREARRPQTPSVPAQLIETARDRAPRRFGLLPSSALTTMAATLLLMWVALVLQPKREPAPFGSIDSGSGRPAATSSAMTAERSVRNGAVNPARPHIAQPVDGAVVAELPMKIRWSSSPGALQYSVQVLSLEGDLVWEGVNEEMEILVPPEVDLEPGQRYYVWVEARLPSGAVSRSEAVAFRLAPD